MILETGAGLRLEVEVAESRAERMRGLLRRERLPPGRGLLIENARSIHTFGMRFAIEAAFLDAERRVVAVRSLPPGRVTLPRARARAVLECPVGTGLSMGDRLRAR